MKARAGLLLAGVALCMVTPAVAGATYVGGVNTVTAPFQIHADVCPASSGLDQDAHCGVYLQGRQINRDTFAVCADCRAHSSAAVVKWRNLGKNTWLGAFRAPTVFPAGATVTGVVTSRGHIGRYLTDQLTSPQPSTLTPVTSGCLGLDITAQQLVHFDPSLRAAGLPVIPCTAPADRSSGTYLEGVRELVSGQVSHATTWGRVTSRSELTIVQVQTDGCAADPNAFPVSVVRQPVWLRWSIHGSFSDDFQTTPRMAGGEFCEYIQTGGLWHGEADGWLVEYQPFTYATGDTLNAPSAAPTLASAGAVTTTLTGTAGADDNLVTDDALLPCADTATAEASIAFASTSHTVQGSFSQSLQSGNFTQSGYVCAYLTVGEAPDILTVADAVQPVTVSGTALVDNTTYPETVSAAFTPVSDPWNGAGTASGTPLTSGATVAVRCIDYGYGSGVGDQLWYELTSSPWGDAYFAPAGDFVNGGKAYDAAVPFCSEAK